jgi:hypothetical protein
MGWRVHTKEGGGGTFFYQWINIDHSLGVKYNSTKQSSDRTMRTFK